MWYEGLSEFKVLIDSGCNILGHQSLFIDCLFRFQFQLIGLEISPAAHKITSNYRMTRHNTH